MSAPAQVPVTSDRAELAWREYWRRLRLALDEREAAAHHYLCPARVEPKVSPRYRCTCGRSPLR